MAHHFPLRSLIGCMIFAVALLLGASRGFSQEGDQGDACPDLPSSSPGEQHIFLDRNSSVSSPSSDGVLRITVPDAILLALENNRALKVEAFTPAIRRTYEDEARSSFDPVARGSYSRAREKTSRELLSGQDRTKTQTDAHLGISGYLPTGTGIDLEMSTRQSFSELYGDDLYASRL
ncbi:MAG: hypothetical protein RRA35_10895, partial [Desulfomonilia bacterium]|nr:hypothetical protein [Desulfomonilia bacterium]